MTDFVVLSDDDVVVVQAWRTHSRPRGTNMTPTKGQPVAKMQTIPSSIALRRWLESQADWESMKSYQCARKTQRLAIKSPTPKLPKSNILAPRDTKRDSPAYKGCSVRMLHLRGTFRGTARTGAKMFCLLLFQSVHSESQRV